MSAETIKHKLKGLLSTSMHNYRKILPISELPPKGAMMAIPAFAPDDITDVDGFIDMERFNYETLGDMSSAIELFVECITYDVYPPESVLKLLSKVFQDFVTSKKSLDKCFNISGNRRLKGKRLTALRNAILIAEIDRNRELFHIKTEDAIDMVCRRLEEKGTPLQELTDIYKRQRRNAEKDYLYHVATITRHHWLDDERRLEEYRRLVLDEYPLDVRERVDKLIRCK